MPRSPVTPSLSLVLWFRWFPINIRLKVYITWTHSLTHSQLLLVINREDKADFRPFHTASCLWESRSDWGWGSSSQVVLTTTLPTKNPNLSVESESVAEPCGEAVPDFPWLVRRRVSVMMRIGMMCGWMKCVLLFSLVLGRLYKVSEYGKMSPTNDLLLTGSLIPAIRDFVSRVSLMMMRVVPWGDHRSRSQFPALFPATSLPDSSSIVVPPPPLLSSRERKEISKKRVLSWAPPETRVPRPFWAQLPPMKVPTGFPTSHVCLSRNPRPENPGKEKPFRLALCKNMGSGSNGVPGTQLQRRRVNNLRTRVLRTAEETLIRLPLIELIRASPNRAGSRAQRLKNVKSFLMSHYMHLINETFQPNFIFELLNASRHFPIIPI